MHMVTSRDCYQGFRLLFFFSLATTVFICLENVNSDISAEYTGMRCKSSSSGQCCVKSVWARKLNKHGFIYTEISVCTVPKTHNIIEGVWWEHGVTVGHQSQIWSLPASWQRFSPWLMFSDDNIWPLKLWLFLAALNGNYCGISSVGLISCSLTQPLSLSHFVCRLLLLTEL